MEFESTSLPPLAAEDMHVPPDFDSNESSSVSQKAKLPYFHRTLTPEESKLIGDITPKRISESPHVVVETTSSSTQGSAWNAAKIWEEKDLTSWAREYLTGIFSEGNFSSNGVVVSISDASDVKGHANLTYSRGKPRYMYSFSFTVTADVEISDETYSAKITVDDVINDMLDDIEISCEWSSRPTNVTLKECNTAVTGKSMKEFIIQKTKGFEIEYQKK